MLNSRQRGGLEDVFGFALGIAFFLATGLGIFHAFGKHGPLHGVGSVMFPPYAWYFAAETFWHDDFSKIDWNLRTENDLRTLIVLMNAAALKDSPDVAKFGEALEDLAARVKSYPSERRRHLASLANAYRKYHAALVQDVRAGIEKSLLNGTPLVVEESAATLALEELLLEHEVFAITIAGTKANLFAFNEQVENIGSNLNDAQASKLLTLFDVGTKQQIYEVDRVYSNVFER